MSNSYLGVNTNPASVETALDGSHWSVEFWVKYASSPSGPQGLFDYTNGANGVFLELEPGGTFYWSVNPYSDSANIALSAGVWHQIVLLSDGSHFGLVLDDQLKVWDTIAVGPGSGGGNDVELGHDTRGGADFTGSFDEFAIYNQTLDCGTTIVGQSCTATSQIGKHYLSAN